MQHHSCDFAPVRTLRIRVEQAQIRDDVLLVVSGQYGIGGRGIGDIGIKRRLLHGLSRKNWSVNFAFGLWHIDDREAVVIPLNHPRCCTATTRQRAPLKWTLRKTGVRPKERISAGSPDVA